MAYKGPQVVTGPASSTDNTLPRFNGTAGDLVQTSSVVVDDSNNMSGLTSVVVGDLTLSGGTIATTAMNNDITIDPHGSGNINLVTTAGGDINLDNLAVNTNTISSTNTNGNITIDPNGSGSTIINYNGSGSTGGLIVTNTNNTASSQAYVSINTAGTSAGRQLLSFSNTTDTVFSISKASATNSSLVFSGGNPGTNDSLTIAITGEVTNALQPAFMAYQPSTASNVTGDGTVYTLGTTVALTEVFDQNSDFVPTTGVFTAPVTGRYQLGMRAWLQGSDSNTAVARIVTSNRTYQGLVSNPVSVQDVSTFASYNCTVLADMDAGDTATFVTVASGGTLITDVYGDGTALTIVYGNLEC